MGWHRAGDRRGRSDHGERRSDERPVVMPSVYGQVRQEALVYAASETVLF